MMCGFRQVTVLLLFINNVVSQMESPCPRFLTFEPKNPNEPDRIYGVVTIMSDFELNGLWLTFSFDKPTIQFGNWIGIVKTEDNKMYKIHAPKKKLHAQKPMQVRFYIKYNTNLTPPKLIEFRLNGKTLCPEPGLTTESPNITEEQYFTSPELTTSPKPLEELYQPPNPIPEQYYPPPIDSHIDSFFQPPNRNGAATDDEDFFVGDFALFNKPRPIKPSYFDEECGTVVKSPQPLITYGQPTSEGEFPWHAALYHARGIDLTYICGATLISKFHLLTVAHCVTRRKTQSALLPSSLIVYLGKFYLKVWSNPGIQDRQIEKIIVHQHYNSHNFSNDIAVIKLNDPVAITDYVRPVCLWKDNVNLESVIGRQGTVVGWGFDQTGKVTEQLTKAHMPIVSQESCIYSFPEFYSRFTSEHTYCAGFNNGTSVCNGDSGGGMIFPIKKSNPSNPVWELRGMVSISVALQNQFRCDSSHFVVFTDVAKYMDWIKNALTL